MSQTKKINWDAYWQNAPYGKVLAGMGGARLIIPTMFSPDARQIYLKSFDLAVAVDDTRLLSWAFEEIPSRLRNAIADIRHSCEEAHLLEIDYMIVWSLLDKLNELPEDYEYPELYLEKIWNEVRPVKPN
jgi:hypothetical protein